jgi:hypothetical protein
MTSRFEDHNKINIIEDIEKNLENTVNDITLADILQLLTFINDNPTKFKKITENKNLALLIDAILHTSGNNYSNIENLIFTIENEDTKIFIRTIININTWKKNGLIQDTIFDNKLVDFISSINSRYDINYVSDIIMEKIIELQKNFKNYNIFNNLIKNFFTDFTNIIASLIYYSFMIITMAGLFLFLYKTLDNK